MRFWHLTASVATAAICTATASQSASAGAKASPAASRLIEKIKGKYAVGTDDSQTLTIVGRPDGSIIMDMFSLQGGDGGHCSIEGRTAAYDPRGYFEATFEADLGEQTCHLQIKLMKDVIHFTDEPPGSCRSQCGTNASLENAEFPLSSRKTKSVTEADIQK